MKTLDRSNPIPRKTEDPNSEPWLTLKEVNFEIEAIKNGVLKTTGGK